MEEEKQEEIKNTRSVVFIKLIPYLLFVVLGVGLGIFVAQQKPEWFGLGKGAATVQAEADATVLRVGKLITLPSDEKPTVATVTDASKVKDQQFFRSAENGDIVLIYTKAQKAILFRPGKNIIVEVGAVNINNQPVQTPEALPSSSPSK